MGVCLYLPDLSKGDGGGPCLCSSEDDEGWSRLALFSDVMAGLARDAPAMAHQRRCGSRSPNSRPWRQCPTFSVEHFLVQNQKIVLQISMSDRSPELTER
jgi:hypothetical protein